MSAPVDVLAVWDDVIDHAMNKPDRYCGTLSSLRLEESRAAVAELIEAADGYAEAEAALANRELNGINAEPHDKLQRRVHAARHALEAALVRVQGGAA